MASEVGALDSAAPTVFEIGDANVAVSQGDIDELGRAGTELATLNEERRTPDMAVNVDSVDEGNVSCLGDSTSE